MIRQRGFFAVAQVKNRHGCFTLSRRWASGDPPQGKDSSPTVTTNGSRHSATPTTVSTAGMSFEEALKEPRPAKSPHEPSGPSDQVTYPAYHLKMGKFENIPTQFAGGPGAIQYHNAGMSDTPSTVERSDVLPPLPVHDHHPEFDYVNRTGKKEGSHTFRQGTAADWHVRAAAFSLYRCCLRALPLVKHYFWLNLSLEQMARKVRRRFESNRAVRDPEAIRHLLHLGWMEYQDAMMFRRTRASIIKFFDEYEDRDSLRDVYADEENKLQEERSFWNGQEQRKEGPYDGHWSEIGADIAAEYERLGGRIPRTWTTAKSYFELMVPDGTNYWEKNLDYEGWYVKNVDPDKRNARLEMQSVVDSSYSQPKHDASKNRRAYRRSIQDLEQFMENSTEENYARFRELLFQHHVRETFAESNRIHAEKKVALQDDEVFGRRHEEVDQITKQVMREMPNPRMWRTDAFYCRHRFLSAKLEYNWAKVPIGQVQEKLYNEWISDGLNFALLNSDAFQRVKRDPTVNPMAGTFARFYALFDPDVPETRRLPWYHPEFDYERRHKWDEYCMRKKKWVDSGEINGVRPFFDSYIYTWEQHVNRAEFTRNVSAVEKRYVAPAMVQLYRSLNRLMDVALVNQMRQHVALPSKSTDEELQKAIKKANFASFRFQVPVIIYPDGWEQPPLGLDGTPMSSRAEAAPAEAHA